MTTSGLARILDVLRRLHSKVLVCEHVKLWQQVIDMLNESGAIGESSALCFPRHPNTAIEAATGTTVKMDIYLQWESVECQ